jgi:hypothetical protein
MCLAFEHLVTYQALRSVLKGDQTSVRKGTWAALNAQLD